MCGATHPERGLACTVLGRHADHAARDEQNAVVIWENLGCPMPPMPWDKESGTKATKERGRRRGISGPSHSGVASVANQASG